MVGHRHERGHKHKHGHRQSQNTLLYLHIIPNFFTAEFTSRNLKIVLIRL